VLQRLQRLPGFDNEAFIQAMSSIQDARFVCWRRMPPAGPIPPIARASLSRRAKAVLLAGLVLASVVFFASSLWWPLYPEPWESGLFLAGAAAFFCLSVSLYGIALRRRQVAPGVAGLAVLAALFVCMLDNACIDWIGSRSEVLTVRVVDQQTGQPIPNAFVRVSTGKTREPSNGRTDTTGEAQLLHEFWATGRDSHFGFRKSASIAFWDTTVAVEAGGYEPGQMPLEEATGRSGWKLGGPPLPPVVVQMRKK
jgi:hypothetical protein